MKRIIIASAISALLVGCASETTTVPPVAHFKPIKSKNVPPVAAPSTPVVTLATPPASAAPAVAFIGGSADMAAANSATATPAQDPSTPVTTGTAASAVALGNAPATVPSSTQVVGTTPGAVPAATATTPAPSAAVMTPEVIANTQQFCRQLKQQFQTQLPFATLQQMSFKTLSNSVNPLTQTGQTAVCKIMLNSNGDTILRNGLTIDFMVGALERLDWQNTPELQDYTADSPTAHRIVMTNGQYLAVVNYHLDPPAGACPNNKPIAACKYPRKKWIYGMQTEVFLKAT